MEVVKGKEKSYDRNEKQHTDDVLETSQVQSEWLICLLEEFEKEKWIAVNEREVSQVVKGTGEDTSLQLCVMLTSILESVSDYVTAAKVLEDNLLLKVNLQVVRRRGIFQREISFKIFRKFGR